MALESRLFGNLLLFSQPALFLATGKLTAPPVRYEVIQVLKRTVFAFLSMGVPFENASIQCLCAELVILMATIIHFVHLPYIYGGLDKLGAPPRSLPS